MAPVVSVTGPGPARVKGVLDQTLVGPDVTVGCGNPGVSNPFEVIAVDTVGNASAPAILTAP